MVEPNYTDPSRPDFQYRVPPRIRLERGEPLAWWEWIEVLIARPLSRFTWRCRITPGLRERCVDFVVRSGRAGGAWDIQREADTLATYIAKGNPNG